MINIDIDNFNENLRVTQYYCEQQILSTNKHFASKLRSINPEVNGQKLFTFDLNEETDNAAWTIDPYQYDGTDKLDKIFNNLFELQLSHKKTQFGHVANNTNFEGEIFAFKIYDTLIDGAAQVSSLGLIDCYNCPPIDTWFYLTNDGTDKILLAWVPIQVINYFEDGIDVNPENCIDWFKTWYPSVWEVIKPTIKNTKFSDFES